MIEQLHSKVLQWADDKGILKEGTPETQALKLGSEVGELCLHISTGADIKDDIGDCLVVCISLGYLEDIDVLSLMLFPAKCISTPMVSYLVASLGDIQDAVIDEHGLTYTNLAVFIGYLDLLAKSHSTTLQECLAIAYNDIKDRTGTLTDNGNFIKDTK